MIEPDPEEINAALRGTHKLLPASEDAERGVLGSFLLAPKEIGALCAESALTTYHFHYPQNSLIYSQLFQMWCENEPIDIVTLTQSFRDKNRLTEVGGAPYITELFTFLPTATNAEYYIGIVIEKFTLRQIIGVCTEYGARCYEEQDDVPGLLSEVTAKICKIGQSAVSTKPKTPQEMAVEAAIRAEERMENRGIPDFVMKTGIGPLDDAMSGIRLSDYILISGKEKAGKTSLAFNILENVVFAQKKRVMVISHEMKLAGLVDRLIASMGKISLTNILNGWMSNSEIVTFTEMTGRIGQGKFSIRDDIQTIGQIMAVLRQGKSQHPDLELAIIDYLQMIDTDKTKKEEMRELVIANISRSLRRMANELNIAIIVLVQLNEDGQVRESRSPGMDCTAHIRIEPGDEEGKKWARIVYQRNGPSNVGIPLLHRGEFVRFDAIAPDPTQPDLIPEPKTKHR